MVRNIESKIMCAAEHRFLLKMRGFESYLSGGGAPSPIFPSAGCTRQGRRTAAERLGLAQAPLDYEDIIYFS